MQLVRRLYPIGRPWWSYAIGNSGRYEVEQAVHRADKVYSAGVQVDEPARAFAVYEDDARDLALVEWANYPPPIDAAEHAERTYRNRQDKFLQWLRAEAPECAAGLHKVTGERCCVCEIIRKIESKKRPKTGGDSEMNVADSRRRRR
jgi:hypothetical protein